MSDAVSSGMIALQQVLTMMLGALFLGIGAALLADDLAWHAKAARVAGVITGLRQKKSAYYPVYRYEFGGETFEMTSLTGSSRIDDKQTGKTVPLLLFPADPRNARAAGSYAYAAGSLFFLLPGAPLVYSALTLYPVTRATYFMVGCLVFFGAAWSRRITSPGTEPLTLRAWKAAMRQKHDADMKNLPLRRLEEIAPSLAAAPGTPAKPRPPAAPGLLVLVGAVAVLLGLWLGLPLLGAPAGGQAVSDPDLKLRELGVLVLLGFGNAWMLLGLRLLFRWRKENSKKE
jgi:hypothetical protein